MARRSGPEGRGHVAAIEPHGDLAQAYARRHTDERQHLAAADLVRPIGEADDLQSVGGERRGDTESAEAATCDEHPQRTNPAEAQGANRSSNRPRFPLLMDMVRPSVEATVQPLPTIVNSRGK